MTLLENLKNRPRHYLAHCCGQVRSLADWIMQDFGLRHIRLGVYKPNPQAGHRGLARLEKRLLELGEAIP